MIGAVQRSFDTHYQFQISGLFGSFATHYPAGLGLLSRVHRVIVKRAIFTFSLSLGQACFPVFERLLHCAAMRPPLFPLQPQYTHSYSLLMYLSARRISRKE